MIDGVRAPGVAVGPARLRGLQRRPEALRRQVEPELEPVENRIRPPHNAVRVEEVVREVDRRPGEIGGLEEPLLDPPQPLGLDLRAQYREALDVLREPCLLEVVREQAPPVVPERRQQPLGERRRQL